MNKHKANIQYNIALGTLASNQMFNKFKLTVFVVTNISHSILPKTKIIKYTFSHSILFKLLLKLSFQLRHSLPNYLFHSRVPSAGRLVFYNSNVRCMLTSFSFLHMMVSVVLIKITVNKPVIKQFN
jgi:hypothetical protein